jgi:hypothetical protein
MLICYSVPRSRSRALQEREAFRDKEVELLELTRTARGSHEEGAMEEMAVKSRVRCVCVA